MKKQVFFIGVFICLSLIAKSQTPVVIASQPNFTYTETFGDIDNWVFSTSPANGTFTAGTGSAAWKGVDISATGSIPSAQKTTIAATFFQTPPSGTGGYSSGIYKGSQNLVLLTTGTTDNTNAIAIDFFADFTGVNANTLSFDWAAINNSTGNRAASLRVYASVDGISYTEITTAQVLNIANNAGATGSISNITLPSIFSNSATARLRFYYHNGSGGTSGSRPRFSIDNVKITAVPTAACAAPATQPTIFTTGSITNTTIAFSFTAASPAPNNYIIVASTNAALSSNPANGVTYAVDDNLGDGTVIAITSNTSFTATGLQANTKYYFFIFSVNNACTGGPLYLTTNPLTGNATTLAGALNCVAPANQPTNLVFSNITTSSITGNFTAASGTDEYLVIRSLASSFTGTLNNGTTYNGGNLIGNGMVVTRTAATTFTANNLTNGTAYYFFVFGLNNQNCNNGPAYKSTSPLTNNTSTVSLPNCTAPSTQATQLQLLSSNTIINGYFTASANADGYLIVRSTSSSLTNNPINGTNYAAGATLGNGTVIANGTATSFIDVSLTAATTYHYFVFAKNSVCNGSVAYATTNPLTGNIATTAVATNNFYYGNLHAHSSYSDGNVDNTALTPADDYAYAKNSLCMDFLGISEHNHATAGMSLSNWAPAQNMAAAATTSSFLALYGMEWGVISNGGHVLVYGSPGLIGWENNNYNTYVAKSNYLGTPETTGTTGLFRTINTIGNNAFATYAHPNFSDYQNLANIAFNSTADSAVVGSAVASGVAFSTNTTYSDPPSSMGNIDYYTKMLSKGYHIGPLMDHDTHYTNFGRSSNNRLSVVMPSLNSNNFYNAMRNRRFYASEDCDTKVYFSLNNATMGSITNGVIAPAISAYAIDPTNSAATPSIKLMYGEAGSNILPVTMATVSSNTLNYTDFALTVGATGYYYLDITIAGNRTITAPIWYTKNNNIPTRFIDINALLQSNRTVLLSWETITNNSIKSFIIEKSIDGVNFTEQATVAITITQYTDEKPNEGANYYRIKQIDANGTVLYSKAVFINLKTEIVNAVNIFPNPVQDYCTLNINATTNNKATLIISDVFGRTVETKFLNIQKGNQSVLVNTNNLSKGNYMVTLVWDNIKQTLKMVKL